MSSQQPSGDSKTLKMDSQQPPADSKTIDISIEKRANVFTASQPPSEYHPTIISNYMASQQPPGNSKQPPWNFKSADPSGRRACGNLSNQHITHHTSHITHHTSHITHHTPTCKAAITVHSASASHRGSHTLDAWGVGGLLMMVGWYSEGGWLAVKTFARFSIENIYIYIYIYIYMVL